MTPPSLLGSSARRARGSPVNTLVVPENQGVGPGGHGREASRRVRPLRAMSDCAHLDQIVFTEPPDRVEGCPECLRIGSRWVHLRMCQICGTVGCCDSSPNQHASRHARAQGHPILRSIEPGEEWSWCVIDEVAFVAKRR
jgi:Zn-finger in ubiquitin-hydrolases and other protein